MNLSEKALGIKPSSTLSITEKAGLLRKEGKNVISFSIGEPDFDTPEHIKKAAIDAINEGFTRYTAAAGIVELRQAVADKLKKDNGLDYDYTQIVISNGAKHSLINALMAVLNPGDEVIIPAPYWLSYAEMVRIALTTSKNSPNLFQSMKILGKEEVSRRIDKTLNSKVLA